MLVIFGIANPGIWSAKYAEYPFRPNLPNSPRRVSVVYGKAAARPVAGGGVFGRLAGNFALWHSLRQGLRRNGAHRQRRDQRLSHSAKASPSPTPSSTAFQLHTSQDQQ